MIVEILCVKAGHQQRTTRSRPVGASQGITAQHELHAGLITIPEYIYNVVVSCLLPHSEYIPLLPN